MGKKTYVEVRKINTKVACIPVRDEYDEENLGWYRHDESQIELKFF
jgi:hypothetical protein